MVSTTDANKRIIESCIIFAWFKSGPFSSLELTNEFVAERKSTSDFTSFGNAGSTLGPQTRTTVAAHKPALQTSCREELCSSKNPKVEFRNRESSEKSRSLQIVMPVYTGHRRSLSHPDLFSITCKITIFTK